MRKGSTGNDLFPRLTELLVEVVEKAGELGISLALLIHRRKFVNGVGLLLNVWSEKDLQLDVVFISSGEEKIVDILCVFLLQLQKVFKYLLCRLPLVGGDGDQRDGALASTFVDMVWGVRQEILWLTVMKTIGKMEIPQERIDPRENISLITVHSEQREDMND